jgi:myosin-crossreactive antigen
MKERFGSAMCAALVVGTAFTLCAQESATAKPITVTGCVGRAQEQQAPTTGTTGAATATPETKFVLTNASVKTSETTGTSGTAAPSATAISSEYRLDSDDAKLTTHVGHKVEITGTIEQPSRTEQKPPASAANAPTLKVDSVRMISSTCS